MVLSVFNDNRLSINELFNFDNSIFIFLDNETIELSSINNVVSSANMVNLNILDAFTKSLIYIKNKIGPRIVPWGTPQFIVAMSEYTSLYNTI